MQDFWLPTPLACSPFTSPTVRTVCLQVSTELHQRVRYSKVEGYVFRQKKKNVLYQNTRRTAQKTVTLTRHCCFTRKNNNTDLSDIAQVGNDSTDGHLHTRTYTCVTGSLVEIQTQNTVKSDRPQYDHPPTQPHPRGQCYRPAVFFHHIPTVASPERLTIQTFRILRKSEMTLQMDTYVHVCNRKSS